MNIFEDRGGGKLHWKLNLYVLWVCVFFTCASYTMCVPFCRYIFCSIWA